MSRSIHWNRSLREFRKRGYLDFGELWKKRKTKNLIRVERKEGHKHNFNPIQADAIPINFVESSEYLFYAVTESDLKAVMDGLPPGTLNGVGEIRLSSGFNQMKTEPVEEDEVTDPYTNRRGYEVMPDVFAPLYQGLYRPAQGLIFLFSYVKGPKTEIDWEENLFLKIELIYTFVHELAHHYDWTNRVARGRWTMGDEEKAEGFAESLTLKWYSEYAMPVLERLYL